MIFGDPGSARNALTEEKYRKLAGHFIEKGFAVDSILYHDLLAAQYEEALLKYDAILVWVNPIEQGTDRKILDELLVKLYEKGCLVSAHPGTILRMGTKEVLFRTRDVDFGGDIKLYDSFDDFKLRFIKDARGIRVLKQYRGNGGNGVFKIDLAGYSENRISVTHAQGHETENFSVEDFFTRFASYFSVNGMLIDQPWNPNIINGMVRCYLSGKKVAGFGYQEVNALYPSKKPGQRFYFSEDCGLFQDLRKVMENKWVSDLQNIAGISDEMLPVIWDADFFINDVNCDIPGKKYSLCEINASCVSPFPESSISYIVEEVMRRLS